MFKPCCVYSVGVLALLLLIAGISLNLSGAFVRLVQSAVKRKVILKNGTEAFEAWKDPPAPIYMQFYFFNLTNPLEVLDGERPAVLEIGPYTYREYRPMEEVDFQDNGTKVSAINTKTYIFQRNMSHGPESDLIRTVDIPAMTVMMKFKDSPFIAKLISDYMGGTDKGLFSTHTVGELLWGYEDGLLSALKVLDPNLDNVFGLFYKSNASNDGEYILFTGQQNSRDFARVDTWNGQSSLNWWTTDECNMINGTTGALFHPVVNKDEVLYMFSSDLCRSLYAVYEEDVMVKGVSGYRFSPPSEVFANLTVNPGNAGFCVPAGNCLGSGVLNVSPCKQGAPIIMSSPHFYLADEKFVKDIFGMKPKKEHHQTTIDIFPLTGTVMQAAKRLQVNVHVEKISTFSPTGDIRTLVFPVVYLNESVVVDDASVVKLKSIAANQQIVIDVPFMVISLGIILGVIFMFLMCQQRNPQSTDTGRQPLLSS